MNVEKDARPALATRRPGGNLRHAESYPTRADLQVAGLDYAAVVRNVEERALSSIWHGLPDSYDVAVEAGLTDAAQFAYAEHSELFRFLMACGLHGFTDPRAEDVRDAFVDVFPDSFLKYLDQFQRIRWATASAACLKTDAQLMLVAAHRRRRFARHWRWMLNHVADPFGESRPRQVQPTTVPNVMRRFSPRAIARILEGADA